MNTWEALRIDWVNGNRSEVLAAFKSMSKPHIFKIINEAIQNHYEYWDPKSGVFSGDLKDLQELIRLLAK
jgi:hypothetical protein